MLVKLLLSPGWPRFHELLGNNSDAADGSQAAYDYYAFIIHLLEGQIIEKLSEGTLRAVLRHLYSQGAVQEYETELVESRMEAKGHLSAAVLLFTLLGVRTDKWPVMFFQALREEAPELLEKIAVAKVHPSESARLVTRPCAPYSVDTCMTVNACMHICTHLHVCEHTVTCILSLSLSHIILSLSLTHIRMHSRTHAHTHTHTHARTHTHTHM